MTSLSAYDGACTRVLRQHARGHAFESTQASGPGSRRPRGSAVGGRPRAVAAEAPGAGSRVKVQRRGRPVASGFSGPCGRTLPVGHWMRLRIPSRPTAGDLLRQGWALRRPEGLFDRPRRSAAVEHRPEGLSVGAESPRPGGHGGQVAADGSSLSLPSQFATAVNGYAAGHAGEAGIEGGICRGG